MRITAHGAQGLLLNVVGVTDRQISTQPDLSKHVYGYTPDGTRDLVRYYRVHNGTAGGLTEVYVTTHGRERGVRNYETLRNYDKPEGVRFTGAPPTDKPYVLMSMDMARVCVGEGDPDTGDAEVLATAYAVPGTAHIWDIQGSHERVIGTLDDLAILMINSELAHVSAFNSALQEVYVSGLTGWGIPLSRVQARINKAHRKVAFYRVEVSGQLREVWFTQLGRRQGILNYQVLQPGDDPEVKYRFRGCAPLVSSQRISQGRYSPSLFLIIGQGDPTSPHNIPYKVLARAMRDSTGWWSVTAPGYAREGRISGDAASVSKFLIENFGV